MYASLSMIRLKKWIRIARALEAPVMYQLTKTLSQEEQEFLPEVDQQEESRIQETITWADGHTKY